MASDYIAAAVAAENQQGRRSVGAPKASDFYNATGGPERGFVRPKAATTADGDLTGGAGNKGRASTNADADGAAHTIKAVRSPQVPEAAPTQGNGKIISASHRGGKNFWSQA